MVTYNSASYVAQAIESVLCQSYENLELLICDDCSTDETWDIVQSYRDPRIKAIRNTHNLGEYPNRNQAVQLARGEYLIYIDGDDILYAHGLEFMVRMLHAFPDCATAIARPWSEKMIYPVELNPHQLYQSAFLGEGAFAINFAHLLFRTSVLRNVGGLSTRFRGGDTWVQYRIALTHPALLISDGLAWWRRTPGQASEKLLQSHGAIMESLHCRREFLEHPLCPLTTKEKEDAFANIYGGFVRIVLRHFARGRARLARQLLREANLPSEAWRYAGVPGRYPAFSDINAANPLAAGQERSPFARLLSGTPK